MKISLVDYLKKIPRYICYLTSMLWYRFLYLFYTNKEKYKSAWLICERGTEAKDNGYWMFRYMRLKHPEIKAYYVIDSSKKNDYNKVKEYGNIIEYGSFEHKMAIMGADVYISTHIGYLIPWNYLLFKLVLDRKNKKKYVFLQHGITKDDISFFYNKKTNPIDLFVTSTNDEYHSIVSNSKYGYDEGVVVLTGMPRFDNLAEFKTKRQILFMPTWRSYILSPSYKNETSHDCEIFLNSHYYNAIFGLLKNKKLSDLLVKYNVNLIFYPHYEIQKFLSCFDVKHPNIIIADHEHYDIQTLLKESLVLITDYSSVFFDFSYMKKPSIMYQFDEQEFFKNQYEKGYFDYERDCFGKITRTEEDVVNELQKIMENNFKMESKYLKRVRKTFLYNDDKNCERVYNEVLRILKGTKHDDK